MVAPGSVAAKARLAVGDRLLSADGKPLNTTEDVSRSLCGRSPGDRVSLKVRRGKKEFKVTLEF
jgi:S1-C subfamily serine protease